VYTQRNKLVTFLESKGVLNVNNIIPYLESLKSPQKITACPQTRHHLAGIAYFEGLTSVKSSV
jgi:hypothetical protein